MTGQRVQPSTRQTQLGRSSRGRISGITDGLTLTRIDLATQERFLSLRRALGVEAFGINQLTLQPGQRGRIHRHRLQEEV